MSFQNSDQLLLRAAKEIILERRKLGLDGMTGDLQFIVVNVEPFLLQKSAQEILSMTGFNVQDSFEDDEFCTVVLSTNNSADILLRSRKGDVFLNPFYALNKFPRSKDQPNTRLEALFFECEKISEYFEKQINRGTKFMQKNVCEGDEISFVQTLPSPFTHNSVGVVKFRGNKRNYRSKTCRDLNLQIKKPIERKYLENVKYIDHLATRIAAKDRDNAILEFMSLTDFDFEFAIYVESLNSITNVARRKGAKFAHVFTSGISEYSDDVTSGPTEKFVHNYGPRTHHVAFHTEDIDETYSSLEQDGVRYLVPLVGSREEGLKQTFTVPSKNSMLVTEYIHRFDGFDGFFTKSNVTKLTAATF